MKLCGPGVSSDADEVKQWRRLSCSVENKHWGPSFSVYLQRYLIFAWVIIQQTVIQHQLIIPLALPFKPSHSGCSGSPGCLWNLRASYHFRIKKGNKLLKCISFSPEQTLTVPKKILLPRILSVAIQCQLYYGLGVGGGVTSQTLLVPGELVSNWGWEIIGTGTWFLMTLKG